MQERVLAGRYRLLAPIGAGGAAQVYRAEDLRLGRQVAVKLLRPQFVADAEQLSRFENEARSAASLAHPNVVDVYDYGQADGTVFIVMQYIDGDNLKQYIAARGKLHPIEAARIALAVCRGLDAAHARGFIHRDVKPQNIMIDRAGQVRITDFGIAKALGGQALTQAGMTYGTAAYLSPEQATGAPVGPATDAYSLGLVLYEMLTGQPAVDGEHAAAVAYKQVYEQPKPLYEVEPGVPPQLQRIVERAIAKDPALRYQSANAMAADLTSFLSTAPAPTSQHPIAVLASAPTIEPQARYGPPVLPQTAPPSSARAAVAAPAYSPTAFTPQVAVAGAGRQFSPLPIIGAAILFLLLGGFLVSQFLSRGAPGNGSPSPTPLVGGVAPTATIRVAAGSTPTTVAGGVIEQPTLTPTVEQQVVSPTSTTAPTALPTDTAQPEALPTDTAPPEAPPTDTTQPVPQPTATPQPPEPTDTLEPTATPEPAQATDTPEPPTPTDTPEPPAPTDTPERPAPPTNTVAVPTPTIVSSGSPGRPVFPTPTVPTAESNRVTLEDVAFSGGYRYAPPSVYPKNSPDGRTATWIYGAGTPFGEMSAPFNVAGLPSGTVSLLVLGLDSEGGQKTPIRISINGAPIYEGANPLPDYPNWGSYTFTFDAGPLQQGQNTITFSNLSPSSEIGLPPFLMIDLIQIQWETEQ